MSSIVNRRVRWTDDERATLIRRCQSLRLEFPTASIAELLEKGQEVFPLERRRPAHPPLRSWLASELRHAGPAPGEPTAWRPVRPEVLAQEPAPDANVPTAAGTSPAAISSADASIPSSPAVESLIETGVQVLLGILRDARVKTAVAKLLSPPMAVEDGAAVDDANRRSVVVAGIPSSAISAVEKAMNGTLQLRFWSPEQPRERLQQLLPEARLVIGMPDGLSPALESSLQSLGARYVRHDSGVSGLYRRLAGEALR